MLCPVKVFRPTKELCYKNGMKLTRIYTKEEVQDRADELFAKKPYIHPSVLRKTKKEIEATNAGLNR
jgi:hypothetical protein